jgi:hypothetical protein
MEAIGSATIVEAMIIYHMIVPSPTSMYQTQARRTMRMKGCQVLQEEFIQEEIIKQALLQEEGRTSFSLGQ